MLKKYCSAATYPLTYHAIQRILTTLFALFDSIMAASFLVRTIVVDVDASTWLRMPAPRPTRAYVRQAIDRCWPRPSYARNATMPSLLSPASPALFWAWLRYYLAPTQTPDLRVTTDFSDLDPHQKVFLVMTSGLPLQHNGWPSGLAILRILSMAVASPTNFHSRPRTKHKSKAKVGTSKAPDFVMQDQSGKWHVLECKGTQS